MAPEVSDILDQSRKIIYMKKLALLFLFIVLIAPNATIKAQSNTDYQYALIEAVKQKNLGNIPGAIELYRMVLAENDSVAVAHYELGTLLAMAGDMKNAVLHLNQAFELDKKNAWYFDSYIDVLLMGENFDEAGKLLKLRLKTYPDNVEYKFKSANINFLSGKERKALRVLENIEKEFGVSDRVILLKATIYERLKQYEKAQAEVDKIIELFPESVEYYVVAAELAMNGKNIDRAMEYYLNVLELDSLNIYALTNLTDFFRDKKDYSNSFFYLNRSFESNEIDYERKMAILSYYLSDKYFASNHIADLNKLIDTMLRMYQDKREIHLFAADFHIQNKKYSEALAALSPVLKEGSERRYEIWRQGILLANATGQNIHMLQFATDAAKIFPDSIDFLFYQGIAEFELEKYDDVIDTYTNKLLYLTDDEEMLSQIKILLAESYLKIGDYVQSDSLFREIIKADPLNFGVLNNFSYYLSLRNESLKEAKEMSYSVIQNNPNNPTFLDTYAWILFKLKDYNGAERYINEALNFGGDKDPDIVEHAAEIYMEIGNYEKAIYYFEKAVALGADKVRIENILEQIHEKSDR